MPEAPGCPPLPSPTQHAGLPSLSSPAAAQPLQPPALLPLPMWLPSKNGLPAASVCPPQACILHPSATKCTPRRPEPKPPAAAPNTQQQDRTRSSAEHAAAERTQHVSKAAVRLHILLLVVLVRVRGDAHVLALKQAAGRKQQLGEQAAAGSSRQEGLVVFMSVRGDARVRALQQQQSLDWPKEHQRRNMWASSVRTTIAPAAARMQALLRQQLPPYAASKAEWPQAPPRGA